MHGTVRMNVEDDADIWLPSSPFIREGIKRPAAATAALERNAYGGRRPNWPLIGLILGIHVALLTGLILFDVIPIAKPKPEPLVVTLLALPTDPPPQVPVEEVKPVDQPKPQVSSPVQIVQIQAPSPVMPVTVQVAPVTPPVVTPPAPSGPVNVSNLGSKMVAMTPPRYPVESRRRKEQGTVVLSLLLGLDGAVAQINLAQSSGFDRLDKAALEAVRKWRWSPTLRNGEPVAVRGTVDIPFILKA
jgi:periplasmic protein TonB